MFGKAFSRLLVPALFFLLASLPAWCDSQVRIVRLSYIGGGVQIDRGTGHFEPAIVNLPITQGMKLQTKDDGRAEVEFEDGSTLRLAPDTAVRFSRLSLRDSGDKLSVVQITDGTAYADAAGAKGNQLTLEFAHERLTLANAVRVRVGVDDSGASVAALKGDIQIESPSGTVEAKKGQTANFDFTKAEKFTLAKNIQEYPYDSWDKQQDQFRQTYAKNSSNNYSSPYTYGTADLAYYGNFFNAPGYGTLWQPYFVGTGWDPFMNGSWAFSPGWGFGWVSAYPWGWLPYHYGSWAFVPGYGWGWQPGGAWTPWYSRPLITNAPAGFIPPRAPTSGTSTVAVNRGPVPVTKDGLFGSKLVIRNNSAGLGVPRGGVENLSKLSQRVEQHGSATQRVAIESRPQMEMGMPSEPAHGMSRTAPQGASNAGSRSSRTESPRMSAPAPRMDAPHSSPPPSSPSPHR